METSDPQRTHVGATSCSMGTRMVYREKETDIERETETERQRDRETDTDTDTDRHTQRESHDPNDY